jgi:hypothetical protein
MGRTDCLAIGRDFGLGGMISWPFQIGNNFRDKCCEQGRRKQSKSFQVSYVVDMNRCADRSVTWSYGERSSNLRSALLGPTESLPPGSIGFPRFFGAIGSTSASIKRLETALWTACHTRIGILWPESFALRPINRLKRMDLFWNGVGFT